MSGHPWAYVTAENRRVDRAMMELEHFILMCVKWNEVWWLVFGMF